MKILLAVFVGILVAAGIYRFLQHRTATLAESRDTLRTLGEAPFSVESWKAGSSAERAKMLYDFTGKNDVTKLNLQGIKDLLGEPDVYVASETTPAYKVGPDSDYIFSFYRSSDGKYRWMIEPVP